MYSLTEYIENCPNLSEKLCQYQKDDPRDNIPFSESLKAKAKITAKATAVVNTIVVKTAVSLKYLRKFLTAFVMPIINCEINQTLTWSANCVISTTIETATFTITDTIFYVPVVTLLTKYSTQYLNKELSGINKTPIQVQNNY